MQAEIWKYAALPMSGWQEVDMPEGARLVHIDEQGDGIALWAIVNPLYQSAPTRFAVIGTGWPIPDAATYVGTTVTASGFVWHLLVPATTTEGESDE